MPHPPELKIPYPPRTRVDFSMPYLPPLDPRTKTKFLGSYVTICPIYPEVTSLFSQTVRSDVIVVGRFEGVLRYAHSPFSATSSHRQTTLYAFRVERFLMGRGGKFIKVLYQGGPLPWEGDIGFIDPDDPIPSVGDQYIVFLHYPDHSAVNGAVSPSAISQYEDELLFTDRLSSKILLRKGRALSADLSRARDCCQYRSGYC
jgi:hypothetical protein